MTRDEMKKRVVELVRKNLVAVAAVAGLVVVVLLIAVPIVTVDSPAFFSRYRDLDQNYENLQASAHKGLACSACHTDARGVAVRELSVVGDFYTNIAGKRSTPLFTKFTAPTNEACLRCHEQDWSDDSSRTAKVPHPAHLRVASETRECVKCHKWTAHDEATVVKHKTMPFSGVCASYGCHVGTKQTDQCPACHHSLSKTDWKAEHPKVVQTQGPNGCLETCHEIDQCRGCHTKGKQPTVSGVAVQAGLQSIQTAHAKADWPQMHGTFALQDQTQCMKCHVSDSQCKECHTKPPASHGNDLTAWIGTHKNVAKGNEAKCTAMCHAKPFCDECHAQFKEMR